MKPILLLLTIFTTFQVALGETNPKREVATSFFGVSADFGVPSPFHSHKKIRLHQGIKLSVLTLDGVDYTYQHGLNLGFLTLMQENIGIGCGLTHWVEEDSIGLQVGLISTGAKRGYGVQVGLINGWILNSFHANSSWTKCMNGLQLGAINLAQKSRMQLGLYNHVTDTGGMQIGVWNRCTLEELEAPTSKIQVQIGLFNTISLSEYRRYHVNPLPKCKFWSFGLLNETLSGWFVPLSNFGF